MRYMAGTSSRLTNSAKNTPKASDNTAGFKNSALVDCSAIIGIKPINVVSVVKKIGLKRLTAAITMAFGDG